MEFALHSALRSALREVQLVVEESSRVSVDEVAAAIELMEVVQEEGCSVEVSFDQRERGREKCAKGSQAGCFFRFRNESPLR